MSNLDDSLWAYLLLRAVSRLELAEGESPVPSKFEQAEALAARLANGRQLPPGVSEERAAWTLCAVGSRYNTFKIGRCLGLGGQGLAFIVDCDSVGEHVLKVFDPRLTGDTHRGRAEILRVKNALAAARDAKAECAAPTAPVELPNNIGPWCEFPVRDGQLCGVISEFGGHASITEHASKKPLSIDQRVALFLQVARAIDAGHSKRVVHLDLKPSNVKVYADKPRILDFGSSIWAAIDPPKGLTTRPFGTPGYGAPEQFGHVQWSEQHRADVFALGVLLFELLTDRPLWPRPARTFVPESAWYSGEMIQRGIETVCTAALGGYEAVVTKAIAFAPEERFSSVAALMKDIENVSDDEDNDIDRPLGPRPDDAKQPMSRAQVLNALRNLPAYQAHTLHPKPLFGGKVELCVEIKIGEVPTEARRRESGAMLRARDGSESFPFHEYHSRLDMKLQARELSELTKAPGLWYVEQGPGAGKTILLKHLAWTELNAGTRVPVFVPLAAWAESGLSMAAFVASGAGTALCAALELAIDRDIEQGHAVLLLDAVDELDHLDERVKDRFEKGPFQRVLASRERCPVVISSRPHYRDRLLIENARWAELLPVDDARRRALVELYLDNQGDVADLLARLARPPLWDIADNAFVVSLLAFVARARRVNGEALPERLVDIYDQAIKRLIDKRGARDDDKKPQTTLESHQWRTFFENFALAALEAGKRGGMPERLAIDELVPGALPEKLRDISPAAVLTDGANMRVLSLRPPTVDFLHPTIQEYLAACALARRTSTARAQTIVKDEVWSQPWASTLFFYLHLVDDPTRRAHCQTIATSKRAADPDVETLRRIEVLTLLGRHGDPRLVDRWAKVASGDAIVDDKGRRVNVPTDFEIHRWPVTIAEYRAFLDSKPVWTELHAKFGKRGFKLDPVLLDSKEFDGLMTPAEWLAQLRRPVNVPIVGVSWFQASAYCMWLSLEQPNARKLIRLPQGAEWVRAARGDTLRAYPWGDDESDILARANISKWEGGKIVGDIGRPTPVGAYPHGNVDPVNAPWLDKSVFDLAGNVWEWCEELYDPKSTEKNIRSFRVLRGGSFRFVADHARCSSRVDGHPEFRFDRIGFRPARVVAE